MVEIDIEGTDIGGKDINVATTRQPTTVTPDRYYPGDDMEAIQPKPERVADLAQRQLEALAKAQQPGNLEGAVVLARETARQVGAQLEQSQDLETDGA